MWSRSNNQLIYRFREHEHGVNCIAFRYALFRTDFIGTPVLYLSPDERLLATVGDRFDKQVFVWDLSTGCIVATAKLPLLSGARSAAASAPPSAGVGGRIRVPPPPTASCGVGTTAGTGDVPAPAPDPSEGDVVAVAWGGYALDAKRRPTRDLIFCTVGAAPILWTLNPVEGTLQQSRVCGGAVRDLSSPRSRPSVHESWGKN